MQRRFLLAAAAAGTLATTLGPAQAQTPSRSRSRSIDRDKLPALMGGDFATATSQLAVQKASSGRVKTFARLEIEEQAAVAQAFGSKPGAAGLDEKHAAMLAELEAASGAEFDAMYIDGQITGHRELLAIHQRYARSGDDAMARGASIVGVPSIQTHLLLLQSIKDSLG